MTSMGLRLRRRLQGCFSQSNPMLALRGKVVRSASAIPSRCSTRFSTTGSFGNGSRLELTDDDLKGQCARWSFFMARQYERALDEAERLREETPDFVDLDIGTAYVMLGRFEEAHREWVAVWKRCGAPCDWSRQARERGWAEGGWEGAQRAWVKVADREGFSPFGIAASYTMIGETDEAFAWLERGYRERDPLMVHLKVHPYFDPLRSDPRFDDLLRRIGFPEN